MRSRAVRLREVLGAQALTIGAFAGQWAMPRVALVASQMPG
ncbi:hypothetical protein [Nonomuraea recticatena]